MNYDRLGTRNNPVIITKYGWQAINEIDQIPRVYHRVEMNE